jgi:hypothetical protein
MRYLSADRQTRNETKGFGSSKLVYSHFDASPLLHSSIGVQRSTLEKVSCLRQAGK